MRPGGSVPTRTAAATPDPPRAGTAPEPHWAIFALPLTAAFGALCFLVFGRSLRGGFVSDDWTYIVANPYVETLSLENLRAILDPFGPVIPYAMNYSPVHVLIHAVQVEALGPNLVGYHALNLLLHAATALVLVALLRAARLSRSAAVLGGALFLLHPANTESVAVIFQVKTILATGLGLAALLALSRRPALATALFAIALLTKISAAGVFPVALVLTWLRAERAPPHWAWLAGWAAVLVVVAIPEFSAFARVGQSAAPLAEDPIVLARSIVAIAGRYLVMAATGAGLSAFHATPPSPSWLDPWWICGALLCGLLGARIVVCLVRREEEAAWWLLAAASFAPISQVFPFLYPMADRYLYNILPGLIGGLLLATRGLSARLPTALGQRPTPLGVSAPAVAALALGGLLAVSFGVRAHARSLVYLSDVTMMRDGASRYPDGLQAHVLRAQEAAMVADAASSARSLRAAHERGFIGFTGLVANPNMQPVLSDPRVRAVLDDMARVWIQTLEARERPNRVDYEMASHAYELLGERGAAIATLASAVELGGPRLAPLEERLRQLRLSERRAERARARKEERP